MGVFYVFTRRLTMLRHEKAKKTKKKVLITLNLKYFN